MTNLIVDELETLRKIYNEHTRGSDGFCVAVETHCGYGISRQEIARIGKDARIPETFHYIWEYHSYWLDD